MANTKDAVELIEEDHLRLQHLLERLEGTSTRAVKTRDRIIGEIHRELEVHTKIEEEIFYPALREAADDTEAEEMHYEFLEEHFLAGEVELPRVMEVEADTDEYSAKCSVLAELVRHHIHEEEERMLPRARELFDDQELMDLGRRIQQRKRELMKEIQQAA